MVNKHDMHVWCTRTHTHRDILHNSSLCVEERPRTGDYQAIPCPVVWPSLLFSSCIPLVTMTPLHGNNTRKKKNSSNNTNTSGGDWVLKGDEAGNPKLWCTLEKKIQHPSQKTCLLSPNSKTRSIASIEHRANVSFISDFLWQIILCETREQTLASWQGCRSELGFGVFVTFHTHTNKVCINCDIH